MIDPAHPPSQDSIEGLQQQKTENEEAPTHFSNIFLAYAPSDRAGKGHDWHFISNQEPTDVLIIQLFDNEMEATTGSQVRKESGAVSSDINASGVMHSAFELEGQDEGSEARESLEVRVVAFW